MKKQSKFIIGTHTAQSYITSIEKTCFDTGSILNKKNTVTIYLTCAETYTKDKIQSEYFESIVKTCFDTGSILKKDTVTIYLTCAETYTKDKIQSEYFESIVKTCFDTVSILKKRNCHHLSNLC